MATIRQRGVQWALRWHKRWIGLGVFGWLMFAFSGMMHPLMTWTGPQAAAFFPPQMQLNAEALQSWPKHWRPHSGQLVSMMQWVPTAEGPMLQWTTQPEAPRQYLDMRTGLLREDYDRVQAAWLARYYTGLQDTPIRKVHFQHQFDDAYPWVNRLLPVYRVEFATEDNRVAFVHTETLALANLTNDWKTALQTVFAYGHSGRALVSEPPLRRGMVLWWVVCTGSLLCTGSMLLLGMRKRRIAQGTRRWHRRLGWMLWVPLWLLWLSGGYHVWYDEGSGSTEPTMLVPGTPYTVEVNRLDNEMAWLHALAGQSFSHVSVIRQGDAVYYRLAIAGGDMQQVVTAHQRFAGVPMEKAPLYVQAETGQVDTRMTDAQRAYSMLREHRPDWMGTAEMLEKVTHFGGEYDFRHKRLPVWKATGVADGETWFLDPASGLLVERVTAEEKIERWVFSLAHKWNMLIPFMGRGGRDMLVVTVLAGVIGMAVLGIRVWSGRQRRSPRQGDT